MQIKNVLVVCIGNICRSPIGEYLLKKQCPHLNVSSAGISALVDYPADEKAQHTAKRLELDLSAHRARQLNTQLVLGADLILVMSQRQQKHVEQTWPMAKGKTFRLGHWQDKNIADPFKKEQYVFDEACDLITACVADWNKNLTN
ncbi:low molecular weight phosphotyrosine protein phosphatase [Acinetobacter sp. B5B]|uniref:low molecular weight protein-tyrosine-phosphatase n=1 Tax=Acinetobacter baretiae TaxID=2605383 RepID=UPI0018C26027|nr:low molecular weight protein-tyrosine-phosphatase [Acinetobacter baretiae]MBF7682651.1 low molecular weight phosphotyrosine protein phosphatase [Acinetobacter baretiae]MBF7685636.1 low molecular weight phosphotyrosine protein phosphatase [Acinetobacter baretiae]